MVSCSWQLAAAEERGGGHGGAAAVEGSGEGAGGGQDRVSAEWRDIVAVCLFFSGNAISLTIASDIECLPCAVSDSASCNATIENGRLSACRQQRYWGGRAAGLVHCNRKAFLVTR